MENQKELFKEMQYIGYNICTCGNCGGVILKRTNTDQNKITCPHCEQEIDIENCPDLYK